MIQPYIAHSDQASSSATLGKLRTNGVEDIRIAGIELPSTTSDSNKLRLTLQTDSHAIHKQVQDCFKKGGMIENGMKYLQMEIGNYLQIPSLSITAHLDGEGKYKHICFNIFSFFLIHIL